MKQQVHWVMGPDWTSTNLCTMQEGWSWVVISLYASPIGSPQVVGSTCWVGGYLIFMYQQGPGIRGFFFERTAWIWVFAFLFLKNQPSCGSKALWWPIWSGAQVWKSDLPGYMTWFFGKNSDGYTQVISPGLWQIENPGICIFIQVSFDKLRTQVFAFLFKEYIVKKITNNLQRVVMSFGSSTMNIAYN
jgi:hypothetical protein